LPIHKATTDAALRIARDAGERLLADLSRAEQLTDGWANQDLALPLVQTAMDRSLRQLAETGWIGRENQLISSEFWRVAGDRLKCGLLQLRAREKPRGYAGDFETLEFFYERRLCDHPLGHLFDRYFQNQAAVEAVRARIDLIAASIVEAVCSRPANEPFRIASIGSGPAIDIEIAARLLPEKYRDAIGVQLFDLDQAALDHAVRRIGAVLRVDQIAAHRENLYRISEPASQSVLQENDFIFCTGLFDYLPDESAARMLHFLHSRLASSGRLMVGNFAPHNPSRAYMEWIGNWYLIYRDSEGLSRLVNAAELPHAPRQIGADRTGIDLFVTIDRI
jgi:extracellular factor (EF) 3-hydroxypalmitic acid methyl ester biosynthesis protein